MYHACVHISYAKAIYSCTMKASLGSISLKLTKLYKETKIHELAPNLITYFIALNQTMIAGPIIKLVVEVVTVIRV